MAFNILQFRGYVFKMQSVSIQGKIQGILWKKRRLANFKWQIT
ncbi:hypothetical protein WP8S18E02_01080 [Aeromonas hydrophila]|nr:hypothetical protein WP8S18E02_01080 [Aeromonas hydrophila]